MAQKMRLALGFIRLARVPFQKVYIVQAVSPNPVQSQTRSVHWKAIRLTAIAAGCVILTFSRR